MKRLCLLIGIAILATSCYVSTPVEEFLDNIFKDYVCFKSRYSSDFSQRVELDFNDVDVKYYYTLDGSTPTKSSEYTWSSIRDEFEMFNGSELKVIVDDIGEYPVFSYSVPGNLDGMVSFSSAYYSSTQCKVTIKVNRSGDYYHYTVDGSTPDKNDDYIYSNRSTTIIVDKGATVSVRGRIYYPECYSSVITYTVPSSDPSIGDIGPEGGYIFYDCDADNEYGNIDGLISSECGWRYLEAAPNDLKVCYGVPLVQGYSYEDYKNFNLKYVFGYDRYGYNGTNRYVGTYKSIGEGKNNTSNLYNYMGNDAYDEVSGSSSTNNHAAKLCSDVTGDWFLPSKEELSLMYENLAAKGIGNFNNDRYWSSSEYSATHAWFVCFSSGCSDFAGRNETYLIRPCRSF